MPTYTTLQGLVLTWAKAEWAKGEGEINRVTLTGDRGTKVLYEGKDDLAAAKHYAHEEAHYEERRKNAEQETADEEKRLRGEA